MEFRDNQGYIEEPQLETKQTDKWSAGNSWSQSFSVSWQEPIFKELDLKILQHLECEVLHLGLNKNRSEKPWNILWEEKFSLSPYQCRAQPEPFNSCLNAEDPRVFLNGEEGKGSSCH